MVCSYDLHIHTCLSPCGDEDMTPQNIVAMASILGLDIIAVTDHNSVGNCRSVMEAARGSDLIVLPGMELCTEEEVHVVCLFETLERATAFGERVRSAMMRVKNTRNAFGEQVYMDAKDEVVGVEDILLITACGIGVNEASAVCAQFGGFCYPAHVDRESFGILYNLGDIPKEAGFSVAELSAFADEDMLLRKYPSLSAMRLLRSSDAHSLETLARFHPHRTMNIPERTAAAAMAWIKGAT